jgi:hypothetical protein
MQEDNEALSRRGFLQLGGKSIAVAGAAALMPVGRPQEASSLAHARRLIRLHTAHLEVSLDEVFGVPYDYLLRASGVRFTGALKTTPLVATVCCREPWNVAEIKVSPSGHTGGATVADFRFHAMYAKGIAAAEFTLRYLLRENSMHITLEDVVEHPGFELISIAMPELVTVGEADANAWLAHGDSGGDLVTLLAAHAGQLAPNTFWGDVKGVLPVTMTGHSGAVCVQETLAYMDGTLLAVRNDAPDRAAAMGTTKIFRVNGSECYNLNLGKGAPRNCGTKNTPNLLVGQKSSCRFDFLEPSVNGKKLTWVDGARLVRSRMPTIPNRFYDDKFIYGIRTDEPRFPKPSATFERCREMMTTVHALTDGAPQLVHLWGWQFRGKDTGYPAVDVVDERIGGYEGMMRLKEEAPALNVTLSLSDNYDDAYRSSPAWDEKMIACRPDGQLWKSREWTGEESYIQGLAKYMEGPGPERVRYTCERYKLPGTIHVDVLSYFAIRNDWDPAHPASGIRNLFAGRYRVLEEFKKHGVDVTSEGLRYPYIGKMSMCWYAGGPTPCPFGGQPIPMLSMIYRRSARWGRSSNKDDLPVQLMMFYGEAPHSIVNGDTPIDRILDTFYLALVPWFQTNQRDIEGFSRDGQRTITEFAGEGNRIEIDWSGSGYTVTLGGAAVAHAGATYCPLGEERIAMYCTTNQELSCELPREWQVDRITASALLPGGKQPVTVAARQGKLFVQVKARQPVMIYRNAQKS